MDVDYESARWAQSCPGVVWCESVDGLVQAIEDGHFDVEVGGEQPPDLLLQAVTEAAPRLLSLSLCGCNLDAASLVQLGRALAPSQLRGIGVSNNPGLDVQTWAGFWEQLPRSILKWDFGDDALPDEALPVLVRAVGRGSSVEELFLDGNDFEDIGPLLPVVSATSGLSELDLGDNDLTDAQVSALAAALPGSCLRTLVLGRNPITDASVVPLVGVLSQTSVRSLYLDSTRVTDATLDAIASVLPSTQLEELHVDETQVQDAGVLRLCRVLAASKLKVFDASDNNLSEDALTAIEAVLPADVQLE
uniref:Uncharacterized protein n=1 Tax=Alexandrium catenella TaxID=2925 RepID=A0A7S1RZC9_ALECA